MKRHWGKSKQQNKQRFSAAKKLFNIRNVFIHRRFSLCYRESHIQSNKSLEIVRDNCSNYLSVGDNCIEVEDQINSYHSAVNGQHEGRYTNISCIYQIGR